MHSRALYAYVAVMFLLPGIVMPIPKPDLDFSILDDGTLKIPSFDGDEQIFDAVSPLEGTEAGSDMDLFSLNRCTDIIGDLPSSLAPVAFGDITLQTRADYNNVCPNPNPQGQGSADEEAGDDSSPPNKFPPSLGKTNEEGYNILGPTSKPENDPLRRVFSLPLDYKDERCREFEIIKYAVCSSGDIRDEEKSMAYSFFPVQAFRLQRCSLGEFAISTSFSFFGDGLVNRHS